MTRTSLLYLTAAFVCVFAFPVNSGEPRPSLNQLIDESRKRDGPWGGYPSPNFDSHEVRKHFYGDEAAFRREVAAMLQSESGEDAGRAHFLIMFLDICDETISRILRERFSSVDPWLQNRFCNLLARHPIRVNIEFLVEILEHPDHSANLRVNVAGYLSDFQREYFAGFDADLKDRILKAFLACLDDDREVRYRFGQTAKVGDNVARLMGYFGSFAKSALPQIREKFISAQGDETDVNFVGNKLGLAWSIVCIAPEQSDDELEFILQKAMEGKSRHVRWEAIVRLKPIPVSLSERVIPVLCTIIQKETCIENKILAAEAITAILTEQRWLVDPFDDEWDDESEVGECSSEKCCDNP